MAAKTCALKRIPRETIADSPHTISAALAPAGVLSNYNITYNTAPFTITAAGLTITTNNATRTVGAPNPVSSVMHAGFVNGDTRASLSGTLVCTTTVTLVSPAGTYPITNSGLTSTTYAITGARNADGNGRASTSLTVSPTSLAFSSTPNAASAPQTIAVSNTSGVALIISSITKTGANAARLTVTNVSYPIGGAGLAAGGSCSVSVPTIRQPACTG